MDGLPRRKHFIWLAGVGALGLTAQWALPPLRHGRVDDPMVVFLIGGTGLLGVAAFWTTRDIMRRWRVWQRRRMAPWQRRAQDGRGGALGFTVFMAEPKNVLDETQRVAPPCDAIPAARRRMLLAAVVVIWTAAALLLIAFVSDVLVPALLR